MDPSDLELVRGVRATPALFDPTNSDFKFAYRKEKIWIELSQYLGINMNDARRRWTCLRDKYTRELKSRRLNPNLEYGHDEFFKEMDFLRPYVRKRKQRSSIVCKIKSDSSWDGKLEKYGYNTCDSSYSSSYKIETKAEQDATEDKSYVYSACDSSFASKIQLKPNQQHAMSSEVVNVEEIMQDYQVEKVNDVTMVVDSQNEVDDEIDDDEPLVNDENFEEYQVQLSSDGESQCQTQITVQNCDRSVSPVKQTNNNHNTNNNNSSHTGSDNTNAENEDDFFCKSVSIYLRQLSRVHKIKAKVEMFKILQKYIEIEENGNS